MAVAIQGRQVASPALRNLLRRRFAELGALVLALAALALLVALGSFNPADPSFDTATAQPAHNLAGPPGAAVADLLLQGFGIAGALPGIAMLAWAWRIGSHRGLIAFPLRLAALLAALPVLGGVLAPIPGVHGQPIVWPAGSGLGGAGGRLVAEDALAAGQEMLGPAGPPLVLALGALLALALTVLALGLSRSEWRAAGLAARHAASGSRGAVGVVGRASARLGRFGIAVLDRLNGIRPPEPPPNIVAPGGPRAEPRITVPQPVRQPAKVTTPAAKKIAPPQQPSLALEGPWRFPPISLLTAAPPRANAGTPDADALQANARLLEAVLSDYGVQGRIVEIRPGPVVTLYELEPAPGIRSARVIGLADDVARSLSVTAVRIATVPGRNVIGIEVPNAKRETVFLCELFDAEDWGKQQSRLALALGKDIGGRPVIADLARMPHLLIAGTTGSGKSVGINAMILSLLYRLSPDQCRLILIDPKMLELSVYDGIPHLMAPVVTEPAKAVTALKWTVREMERRYRAMSQLGVRNIGGYNDRVARGARQGRGGDAPRADRLRPGNRQADLRGTAAGAGAAALHRRRDRRDGRPDDGRRQGDRGRGAAAGADGARRRAST